MAESFSLSCPNEVAASSCCGVRTGALFGLSLPSYVSTVGFASILGSEDISATTTGFGCCFQEKEIFVGLIGAGSSSGTVTGS